jgi:hypothetical protein
MKSTTFMKQVAALCLFATVGIGQAIATPSYFTFEFTGADVSGSGDFWANPNGDGTFTAISGDEIDTVNNVATTLLPNTSAPSGITYSPSGAFYYDDQYLPLADPIILLGGLMFGDKATGLEVNLWSNGANNYVYDSWRNGGYSFGYSGTQIVFAAEDPPGPNGNVPEPASVALIGLGLLGFAAARRRNSRN